MSSKSEDLTASGGKNELGPDLFGFYAREATELLSHDDDILPFPHQASHLAPNLHEVHRGTSKTKNSCKTKENNGIIGSASLFSDGLGTQLSEFKKERLKALLRQSVFVLSQEVDEMINPVHSVCRIQSYVRYKDSLLNSNSNGSKDDQLQNPQKKRKVSPTCAETKLSDAIIKECTNCHSTENLQWIPGPDDTKIDDDLRLILENDTSKVVEMLKKHSGELSDTLQHMEQKLEELLNITMTTCRPMTITEKQHLRKLIQNLPPANLDRVVEIIEQKKPSEKSSCDEVYVDLDEQDNVTLWRLYFYIQNVLANTDTKIDPG